LNPIDDLVSAFSEVQPLRDYIDENFDKKLKGSLDGPLKKVQKIINDGNPNNDGAAFAKLDEFSANVLSKYDSGKITVEERNLLLLSADLIKNSI